MFRFVKTLSGGNVHENINELDVKISGSIIQGSAVSCANNVLTNTSADGIPDYIFQRYSMSKGLKICQTITNDMIFRVEYTSSTTPKIGMRVGLSNHLGVADAVAYNSSGKGLIIGIENPNMVYVRFQKS